MLHFRKGQFVIHPRYGAGKVVNLESLLVVRERKRCYVVDPLLLDILIKVPCASVERVGLRLPLPYEEIEDMLKFFREPFACDESFLRTSKISQEISLADPRKTLMVIKSLFYEKIYRQKEGGSLSLSKRGLYSSAISLFASEIVASRGCTLDEACTIVRKSLVFRPVKLSEVQ
ncbi:hypothetical protein B5M47_00710 [candidate division CPR3 bacterium 4484_211]|uniref:CarD-like/TRCF RNAP-interacting domain-containing protein n=1 Tax=candidate division CPR3 bacterium 4484_211 TaxID=1968527 RepID=A0A1W9NZE0_UNCC3|nr:MAG: hypothetical protein B5M47_00710 [candidate division CPR3 bacterium 4484_211]